MSDFDFAPALLQRAIRTIARQTGLLVRPQDEANFKKKLHQRMSALGIARLDDYLRLLQLTLDHPLSLDRDLARSRQEWQELLRLLVVTESYFFRDRGQFDLLRSRLLPELIVKKRNIAARTGERPQLKLWSAACAAGEEAYSLAIRVWELLDDRDRWDLFILGTDICDAALQRARQARYSRWSFRQVPKDIERTYFQQRGDRYELRSDIRRLVRFGSLNLASDDFPDLNRNLYDIDLILCRNVFIYFERPAIDRVLRKFHRTLAAGGYLIAAHAELQGLDTSHFHTQLFPQSVVYQRCDRLDRGRVLERHTLPAPSPAPRPSSPIAVPKPSPSPPFVPPLPPPVAPLVAPPPKRSASAPLSTPMSAPTPNAPTAWKEAIASFQAAQYAEAIAHAERALSQHQPPVGQKVAPIDPYVLIARAYANLGDYQKASYYCMQALELDSLAVAPYYLLAHLCEMQGNAERAKRFLKQIVYIDPKAPLAYLELAQIYRREGDVHRARKMQSSAVELLRSLAPSTPVDRDRQLTAGELLRQVEARS